MVLCALLIVNLRILSLLWWGTTYFVQNSRTIILPGDTRRTASEVPDFGAKLEAWRLKMFHNFLFLQSDMVFGIVNAFSWIFDAVSSQKNCPTSMLFSFTYIEFRTAKFFPPAEFWLVNSNFRCGIRRYPRAGLKFIKLPNIVRMPL